MSPARSGLPRRRDRLAAAMLSVVVLLAGAGVARAAAVQVGTARAGIAPLPPIELLNVYGAQPASGGGGASPPSSGGFRAALQLMPESLGTMLGGGLQMWLWSNQPADGFVTFAIPGAAARQAHIAGAHGRSVVIARGTLSGIRAGGHRLRLRLAQGPALRLKRLRHVTVSVRVTLVAAGERRVTLNAAGRY